MTGAAIKLGIKVSIMMLFRLTGDVIELPNQGRDLVVVVVAAVVVVASFDGSQLALNTLFCSLDVQRLLLSHNQR